jgi:hypothetical protein
VTTDLYNPEHEHFSPPATCISVLDSNCACKTTAALGVFDADLTPECLFTLFFLISAFLSAFFYIYFITSSSNSNLLGRLLSLIIFVDYAIHARQRIYPLIPWSLDSSGGVKTRLHEGSIHSRQGIFSFPRPYRLWGPPRLVLDGCRALFTWDKGVETRSRPLNSECCRS